MDRLSALLAVLVLSVPVHAQTLSAGGPGGGEVRDLVRAPGGPVYAGMARGGVFRSDDGGLSWQAFRDGMVRFGANDLTFGTDGALYAAGARFGDSAGGTAAVYRLAPGAAAWTDLTGTLADQAGLPLQSVLALPGGVLLVGYTNGLYRSADGGATFEDRSAGLYDPSVTDILPLSAGTRPGLQGTGGLLVGTQGGGTFTVGTGGTAADPDAGEPVALHLDAFPNPTAGRLTVAATLAAPGNVRLDVVDVLGRRVATVLDRALGAGRHTLPFDASALPPGLYTLRIEAGGRSASRMVTRLP